jgi:hypothetical protein
VYVGGNFTHVRNASGSRKIKQSYLAAFDARTGAWISSFRPRLNNQVKALVALPHGKLAVGGQFSTLGGKKARGLVVVGARNGKRDKKFTAEIKQTTRGANRWVRTLDVRGKYLYVGGGFTQYRGGSATRMSAYSNILRVSTSTGTPDKRWRPNLGAGIVQANGKRTLSSSVLSLEVADDGRTVYAVGQFQKGYIGDDGRKTVNRPGVAAIRTTTPARFRSWPVRYSAASRLGQYQQAVESVGKEVWLGGSQHSLFTYLGSALRLNHTNLTKNGGDIQAIDERRGVVYASCHCDHWNYSGMSSFDDPSAPYAQVDRIGRVGAWNASTGAYYPEFAPYTGSRRSEGPWAVMSATDGTLWAGGDYTSSVEPDGTSRWTGGFIRYPMRPHTPPASPGGLSVSTSGGTAQVSWWPSPTAGVFYEVLRNDRVVEVTAGTSAAVPDSATGDRWFVRATDGRGNRSASTPAAR